MNTPLRHLVTLNRATLGEDTAPDHAFKYVDISQVTSDGHVNVPDEMTLFGQAPSRARRLASAGDTVVSTVRTYLRAIARVPGPSDELVFSTGFAVLTPREIDGRFLTYACRAEPFIGEVVARSTGVSYPAINAGELLDITIPSPSPEEQRRIADFLDDRVARIDQIMAARSQQMDRFSELMLRHSFDAVAGTAIPGDRRRSSLDWLGLLPSDWPVVPVSTQFGVDLGKMLDEKRQTGAASIPYLRNTNVQWDRTDIADLKEMDIVLEERARYTVQSGDLLVCEGGQPGRAAIWDGRVADMGYQKALHRVRTRGRSLPEWLLECLRVAVNLKVFTVESGQTTIAHLTNEQLRGQRFPFPEPSTQRSLLDQLKCQRRGIDAAVRGLRQSIDLLTEYKSSLITAAVTGELDVTTASRRIPGE